MRNKKACIPDVNSIFTNPGDRYAPVYDSVVDPDGSIKVVQTGKIDLQEQIDSYRDQTDMSFILQRMALGDTSVLTDKTPMYGDFLDMPKTYAEFMQKQIDAQNAFMSLPLDVRNKFDNDFMKWFATSGNEDWFDKMKDYFNPAGDSDQDPVKPEEVNNES